jgi:hypothetical protein
MGTNAIGQTVEHRGDIDLGLLHAEAALDVSQRLVAGRAQGPSGHPESV